MNLTKIKSFVKFHGNDILTLASLVGLAVTAYTSYKAGEKDICTYEEYSVNSKTTENNRTRDLVINKVPMIVSAGTTAGLIICNHKLNAKKKMAMVTALGLMTNALSDYQDEITERYSPKEANEIAQKVYAKNDGLVDIVETVEYADFGCLASESIDLKDGYLFFISKEMTGADSDIWFRSTMLAVTAAEYYTNRNFVLNGEAHLSDFLGFLGLSCPECENVGWKSSIFDDDMWWLDFNHNHVGERGSEEAFYEIIFSAKPTDFSFEKEEE